MEKDEKMKHMYYTFPCIVCGIEHTLFCVGEPNKQAPCSLKCIERQRKEKK